MKVKLISAGVIAAVPFLLLACAPVAQTLSVEVSCDDFAADHHISRQITVNNGDSFTLTLCSNPTTGFTWTESAQISTPPVLEQTSYQYIAPSGDEGMVGAPGQAEWIFQALKQGTTQVFLDYSRPWDGGEKRVWTLDLTVVVD